MRKSIKYNKDSSVYFEQIKDIEGSVYLDSCSNKISQGRFDIITAAPIETIISTLEHTTITNNSEKITSQKNPFELLKQRLEKYKSPVNTQAFSNKHPFNGGAIGYFSYDLYRKIEDIPTNTICDNKIPIMHIGIYDWALIVDHKTEEATILSDNPSEYSQEAIHKITKSATPNKNSYAQPYSVKNLVWEQDANEYESALKKVKYYIHEGDCYQVNYAQRVTADFNGCSWELYKKLRNSNPAPYSAFMKTSFGDILSSSPEQFLSVDNGLVITKPIKGTVKSSKDKIENKQRSEELKNCQKNRAENLMIVDLLRNDIGKVAIPGSIKVTKLFDIESFEGLHHLVSTIEAKLSSDKNAIDLLKGCFPGGSITGAPKIRSMQIIEELEKYQRGIYCGSIGYIDFNGNMDTNIAIRTTLVKNNKLYYSAGGGIVADSNIEDEYQEMKTKAQVFIDTVSGK